MARDCLGMYRRVMRRFVQNELGIFIFTFYLHFNLIVLPVVVRMVVVVYCDVVTAHPLHSCSKYFVDRRHLLTCQESRVQVPERQSETGQTPRLGRSSTSIYILKHESLGDEQVPLMPPETAPAAVGESGSTPWRIDICMYFCISHCAVCTVRRDVQYKNLMG